MEALVSVDEWYSMDEFTYRFDSLDRTDQVPAEVANAIREHGREKGEIPHTEPLAKLPSSLLTRRGSAHKMKGGGVEASQRRRNSIS
jgi:hypothetical protein